MYYLLFTPIGFKVNLFLLEVSFGGGGLGQMEFFGWASFGLPFRGCQYACGRASGALQKEQPKVANDNWETASYWDSLGDRLVSIRFISKLVFGSTCAMSLQGSITYADFEVQTSGWRFSPNQSSTNLSFLTWSGC